jgi:hypothetical protein
MHVAETPTVDTSVAHVQLIVSLGPSMLQIVGLRCSWTWTRLPSECAQVMVGAGVDDVTG